MRQFSIFLENKPGRLASLIDVLAKNGINVLAMGIAEAGNYGIVRCLLDNEERAMTALKDANMAMNLVDVLILELKDIKAIVKKLEANAVNIDYAYTMDGGKIVFKVNDIDKAKAVLSENGIKVLN
ncbi:MAG: acetolactate synthase [Candidatus Methanomethylicia archaeon]|nr:acetolactate synthase [Candidatus Methanomethylicia archaeon]